MQTVDKPTGIRPGEELDSGKLAGYFRETLPECRGNLEIRQFPSGFSNLTYLIRIGHDEFVLRKPPKGRKAKTAHDMSREFRVLEALKPVFPYAPAPVAYSDGTEILGSPFYVMERMKGIILRKNPPKGLVLAPEQCGTLCENMISVLCQLHGTDYRSAGLESLGRPEGYIRRQIEGWSQRYTAAKTGDAPDFENVMQWLHDNQPAEGDLPALIHNDYKFDNLVLDPEDPTRIIGILDWEMATIGDPLMDLGASLAYWVETDDPDEIHAIRSLPTTLAGMLTRKQLIGLYFENSGLDKTDFTFFMVYGLFRLAGIAQQIYYRYHHGQTKDERFKMLVFAVAILERAALKIIAEGIA